MAITLTKKSLVVALSALSPLVAGDAAPGPAAQGAWPGCIEQNSVIRNKGKALFTNVAGYGGHSGSIGDFVVE